MATGTFTIEVLQAETGVTLRTLRHWIRRKLLPKPIGRGRAARYDSRHLVRAHVIQDLRGKRLGLNAIHRRIASLSEEQLLAMLPPRPRALTPEGVPAPPPPPTYPSVTWEMIALMDGLTLMVNPSKGPALRRIADEIYRYYGAPPVRPGT